MAQAYRYDPETDQWVEYDPKKAKKERARKAESSLPVSIKREELERYAATVDQLADNASMSLESTLIDLLQDFDPNMPEKEWKELREGLIEYLYQTRLYWSDAAGAAACEFYDNIITNREGVGFFNSAQLPEQVSRKMCADSIRALAYLLFEGKMEKFVEKVLENAHNGVRQYANKTILLNTRRDGMRGVRYARVPMGIETCAFCIMLASRGFVYYSKKTAGENEHMHVHCDCKIVPGFAGDVIEGYDEKVYKDIYDAAAEGYSLGNRNSNVDHILNYMRREILYPVYKDSINQKKRVWWSKNKDDQNAIRRENAAKRREEAKKRKPDDKDQGSAL